MSKTKEEKYYYISELLLSWYDLNKRKLPWRAPPGKLSNPYFVYLSEIMLQQTIVKTVIPYFLKFIKKWPTVEELAKADFRDISSYWAGLGYYSRAKNLHETAKIISKKYNGIVPDDKNILLSFPGVGNYTASAIMAIAFNNKCNVVDGNVERIFSRLYAVEEPIEISKKNINDLAEKHLPDYRHGDYAQSLMDLGSLVCISKSPRCSICPIVNFCKVGGTSEATEYPKRLPKKNKENRYGLFFCLINQEDSILITTNKNKGLLANMDVLPSIGWYEDKKKFLNRPRYIKKKDGLFNLDWKILDTKLVHIFTHFKLHCSIAIVKTDKKEIFKNVIVDESYRFVKKEDIESLALPSLVKKILKYLKDEKLFIS